ncbi:hypothetical protein KY311_01715 [Candidatus Woesearchaeota archaeon]|nr:hypothetical protein [Candidatus Woesearchaeota archaeon]MBW3017201.1 hypothetical protein [Candidatus Woesearchaeota archaeon]
MNKELLLRAVYSEDGKNMRLDMKKSGISPQEALGILEMAKDRLLDELKKSQVVTQQQ